jgi:hypothetical protein
VVVAVDSVNESPQELTEPQPLLLDRLKKIRKPQDARETKLFPRTVQIVVKIEVL